VQRPGAPATRSGSGFNGPVEGSLLVCCVCLFVDAVHVCFRLGPSLATWACVHAFCAGRACGVCWGAAWASGHLA
jgi:hypothetical protein